MRRIKSRISCSILGRPGRTARDFYLQTKRNPCRCQWITVSGLTMTNAVLHSDQNLDSQTQNTRSQSRPFDGLVVDSQLLAQG
jgi:hypothetical protein